MRESNYKTKQMNCPFNIHLFNNMNGRVNNKNKKYLQGAHVLAEDFEMIDNLLLSLLSLPLHSTICIIWFSSELTTYLTQQIVKHFDSTHPHIFK